MLGSIRRVISEADDMGILSEKPSTPPPQETMQMTNSRADGMTTSGERSGRQSVVTNEHENENANSNVPLQSPSAQDRGRNLVEPEVDGLAGTTSSSLSNRRATFVDDDEDEDDMMDIDQAGVPTTGDPNRLPTTAPLQLIGSIMDTGNRNMQSDTFTTSSSLSGDRSEGHMQDVDYDEANSMKEDTPEQRQRQQQEEHVYPLEDTNPNTNAATLKASDASNSTTSSSPRGGSQNSSRDWGWFIEDEAQSNNANHHGSNMMLGGSSNTDSVNNTSANNNAHDSDGDRNSKKKKKTSALNGGRTGDRQIISRRRSETDAAVMAVTAPTYVLEETLSSQKLWRDTAGQRPPQPVEERLFFEKMWAQNFAQSQVDYRMPVEVLTAASPISLNPFVDGNFDEGAGGGIVIGNHHNTDMMNEYDFAAAQVGQVEASSGDAAEAALLSRMGSTPASGHHGVGSGAPHAPHNRAGSNYHPPSHHHPGAIGSGGTGGGGVNGKDDPKIQGTKRVRGSSNSGDDGDLVTVCARGNNVFGTTVSKSFARQGEKGGPIQGVDTINISIASYRVVESKKYGKYAQFLVIYREGSIRDTIGVWKRYRDFEDLAKTVTQSHDGCAAAIANMSPLAVTEELETEHLPNAITSWRLLQKRKRWYRCLDAGYLSLKVFLLERFLHDILFESSSPKLLREFVAAETALMS